MVVCCCCFTKSDILNLFLENLHSAKMYTNVQPFQLSHAIYRGITVSLD